MLTLEQRRLNAVQRPEVYREVLIDSAGLPVALSVWEGKPAKPAVMFLPGTMTHPLFYEEFLDALNRAGHTVVGVHPAGHGKSPGSEGADSPSTTSSGAARRVRLVAARAYPIRPPSSWARPKAASWRSRSPPGAGAAAVLAHNVLDPALPDTVTVTRVPKWLAPAYPRLRPVLGAVGRMAPAVPVPFGAYLDIAPGHSRPRRRRPVLHRPARAALLPLGLLAGMLTTDLPGPARCPVVVIAASGDPLFSLAYTRQVFARIDAPSKQLLVVDSDQHLIFTDALDVAVPAVLRLLRTLPPPPPTASQRGRRPSFQAVTTPAP